MGTIDELLLLELSNSVQTIPSLLALQRVKCLLFHLAYAPHMLSKLCQSKVLPSELR